ncbi:hypothetical protein WA026_018078, partial [Henosepilachna vigintioctopunctata]
DETKPTKSIEKKRWIHDPSSDLCRPLNCKKKEICLLEDPLTAVCVSRKELKKNGDIVVPKASTKKEESVDEDDDDEDDEDLFYDADDDTDTIDEDLGDSAICKPCPVVKPTFLCGSDNRTYSSLCRLDYHNCIHHTTIKLGCKGFCPCKDSDIRMRKKQRQSDRLNTFMNKYKATLDKSGSASGALDGKSMLSPSKLDVYTFTPQDFKYENKHYKYIKYTKYNNKEGNSIPYSEDKDRMRGYNDVLDNKIYNVDPIVAGKQCSPVALQAMGNRMLDWFSVVMADSSKRRRPRIISKVHFPSVCKGEVRWMFQHLDMNGDSKLSLQELYDLEHDQSEVCLRPFLQQCDSDNDAIVLASEWCRCFQRTERPCAAVKRKLTPDLIDVYVPECDNQGYYRPVQCHSAIGMCWCVDKHGVEYANTRTQSKPNCDKLTNKPLVSSKQLSTNSVDSLDDEDSEDDIDQEVEGSADRPEEY